MFGSSINRKSTGALLATIVCICGALFGIHKYSEEGHAQLPVEGSWTLTPAPSAEALETDTPTPEAPTDTPTPPPTIVIAPSSTPTPTSTPSPLPSPRPSDTPTPEPTIEPSMTPTPSPRPTLTATPTSPPPSTYKICVTGQGFSSGDNQPYDYFRDVELRARNLSTPPCWTKDKMEELWRSWWMTELEGNWSRKNPFPSEVMQKMFEMSRAAIASGVPYNNPVLSAYVEGYVWLDENCNLVRDEMNNPEQECTSSRGPQSPWLDFEFYMAAP